MANHRSAIKKQRHDEKQKIVNKKNLSLMRNKIKSLKRKIASGTDKEKIQPMVNQVVATIDKTVTKGTIHKNTGARYKSRISQLISKSGL